MTPDHRWNWEQRREPPASTADRVVAFVCAVIAALLAATLLVP